MVYDNQNLHFHGFHASELTRAFLNHKMSALLEESPYGASLNATFVRKEPHLFQASIAIYSAAGRFYAKATGNKLKTVSQKLIAQIRKQLSKWKSRRFQHESLKDRPLKSNLIYEEDNYETDHSA
ncbi:MAG: hypothetical protein K2P92_07360 [Bdellovibrionaceae bacterium]|nr:hypothetical protein [Pseudobdellovibrionaceae bacterium]